MESRPEIVIHELSTGSLPEIDSQELEIGSPPEIDLRETQVIVEEPEIVNVEPEIEKPEIEVPNKKRRVTPTPIPSPSHTDGLYFGHGLVIDMTIGTMPEVWLFGCKLPLDLVETRELVTCLEGKGMLRWSPSWEEESDEVSL